MAFSGDLAKLIDRQEEGFATGRRFASLINGFSTWLSDFTKVILAVFFAKTSRKLLQKNQLKSLSNPPS